MEKNLIYIWVHIFLYKVVAIIYRHTNRQTCYYLVGKQFSLHQSDFVKTLLSPLFPAWKQSLPPPLPNPYSLNNNITNLMNAGGKLIREARCFSVREVGGRTCICDTGGVFTICKNTGGVFTISKFSSTMVEVWLWQSSKIRPFWYIYMTQNLCYHAWL